MTPTKIEEGTVLRVTKAVEGLNSQRRLLQLHEVGWAVCTEVRERDPEEGEQYSVDWLHPTIDERPALRECPYVCHFLGDRFTVPPEKDWPDEVCVALAKRALIGG
jgi:hypothetical protein